MELPKNITQVGEVDKSSKIYVEDYVMSYMKQMNRFAEDKEIAIALYGRCSSEAELTYYFVYGACKLDFLQREVKHLSQAQKQEIDRAGRKYFKEHDFLGYIVLNGEMIEGVYVYDKEICRYVKGYACFYEKNDNMLAYMLDNRLQESVPEKVEQEKYEQVRVRQEERRNEYIEEKGTMERSVIGGGNLEKRMQGMRFATAAMFVLLCLVSVVTLQTEGMGRELNEKIKYLLQGVTKNITVGEEDVAVMSGDVMNTLVAEEQLAEAIRQENQQSVLGEDIIIQNSEGNLNDGVENVTNTAGEATTLPMVATEEPVTSTMPEPTLGPTSEPAPVLTPAPTPISTPVPTEIPVQNPKVQNTYIIRPGDTLIGISNSLYGSEAFVQEMCDLNNISNPDNIQIGQKILLP